MFSFLLLSIFAGLTFALKVIRMLFIVLYVIRLILLFILQSHHPTELSKLQLLDHVTRNAFAARNNGA